MQKKLKMQFITKIKYIIIFVIAVALIICCELLGLFKNNVPKNVSVEYGSSLSQIANTLKEEKLINSKIMFKLFAYGKADDFKAGDHKFSSHNYFSIIKELKTSPQAIGITVTIPEGYEQREIALLLEKNNIPKREYELEGYLFPDTYSFSNTESAESIIRKMLNNFESKISKDMRARAEKINVSFDDIVIMASIVEREAAADNEYKKVSGVFYNRIEANPETAGFLQSCATVQYILKERKDVLAISDTKIDSPYNTYKYQGLPAGPIASPGLKTIEAALYPEDTNYLYFVADGNGKHYFAVTYEEHQNNMRKAGL